MMHALTVSDPPTGSIVDRWVGYDRWLITKWWTHLSLSESRDQVVSFAAAQLRLFLLLLPTMTWHCYIFIGNPPFEPNTRCLSSSVHRPLPVRPCLFCGHISKTKQDRPILRGTLLGSWHCWFVAAFRSKCPPWGDILVSNI